MKKLLLITSLFAISFSLFNSCSKDDIENTSTSSGSTIKTTISGMVLDENNAPQNGVTVTAYGETTTTNQYGVFVLKDVMVNKKRCVMNFSKTGFFTRSHAFIASANTVNYVRIVMINNAQTHTVSAVAGGTVTLADGSSVLFAPNSFVTSNGIAYTGTVSLCVKHLSPDAANFGFMIPGNDLAGKNINEDDVTLYTYGMLGVEMKGAGGEALQLATGTTATLTMAIATSQLATAPATIPLWYFDETTSLWMEQGTANKVGNNYVGNVTHFSWWNCDIGLNSPLIKGKVMDCNGNPVPNCVVTVNGWATTLTDQNGEWQGQVPAGLSITVQVLTIYNPWLSQNSQLENVPPLSNNQTFIVPDLIVPCNTRIIGTLKTCSGINTWGTICINDNNSYVNYYFTQDGFFNIIIPENTLLSLIAYNLTHGALQNVTSPSSPTTLELGNIYLCDDITTTPSLANLIFHENFEMPSLADSVFSYSSNMSTNQGWNLNSRIQASGVFCDSSTITPGDTSILITQSFSTVGYDTVLLTFSHICKIDFFDLARIEYSPDGGTTWSQITCVNAAYTGFAPFCAQGYEFSSGSYGDWQPAVPGASPDNSWWKVETFNISFLASGFPNSRIRFVLYDDNIPGGNGNAGWFIDDIVVEAQ